MESEANRPGHTNDLSQRPMNADAPETAQPKADRSYSAYFSGGNLSFDPLKELNLPASYDEVVTRFRKLQGERAVEVLN